MPAPLTQCEANHQQATIDEPPAKRKKTVPAKPSDVFVPWKPSKTTLYDVQQSYRSAIADGRLKFDRVPQTIVRSEDSCQPKHWDPYNLTATAIPRALLDRKIEGIIQRVHLTTRIVPKAVDWIAKTRDYNLAPEDLQIILRGAFGRDESYSIQRPEHASQLPFILRAAADGLSHADELNGRSTILKRAEAVIRMVAYALMEVSVAAGEATDHQVTTIHITPHMALTQGGRKLDESISGWRKDMASEGSYFCSVLVLGDGKSASLEGSRTGPVSNAR